MTRTVTEEEKRRCQCWYTLPQENYRWENSEQNTTSVGRGIVAGCKRSQSMAKAYTNRAVDKLRRSCIVFVRERNTKYETMPQNTAEARRNAPFRGIRVFQHVDDLTQIMWAT